MNHQKYMDRCISLASMGIGNVAPNPMVGAVLVHENRIIGEGYHQQYGEAHAEVNCINSVYKNDKEYISAATLYVSLEPCAHFGKTPPCAHLIIEHKIPRVVIGSKDPFSKVNGKGITLLSNAGIEVITGICEKDCTWLNKRFMTFHTKKRPYIILKWAQTADGFIAGSTSDRLFISNECTNRLVHRWRSEEACILIGTNTAIKDNPLLTNRLYSGGTPVRMFIDKTLRVPSDASIMNHESPTIIFNHVLDKQENTSTWVKVTSQDYISQILAYAYAHHLQSIMVEGGSQLLQSFIDKGIWDECRIITNENLFIHNGVHAPQLHSFQLSKMERIQNDCIRYYLPK